MQKLTLFKSLLPLALLNLSACSFIQNYFPDKEKDYQFSSEIPALKIPPDLVDNSIPKPAPKPKAEEAEPVPVIGEIVTAEQAAMPEPPSLNTPAEAEPTPAPTAPSDTSATEASTPEQAVAEPVSSEPSKVKAELLMEGTPRLSINQSVAQAWRSVGKALTRSGIEITGRDEANALFVVQYELQGAKIKDESFFDELAFVFGENHAQDKAYRLKLQADKQTSVVLVYDANDKVLSDISALSLLKVLLTGINDSKE